MTAPAQYEVHPLKGALYENFIVTELIKNTYNRAERSNLYYFRDSTGNEIDVLIDHGAEQTPIEIKSDETLNPDYVKNLRYWKRLTGTKRGALLYAGDKAGISYHGFEVTNWRLVHML